MDVGPFIIRVAAPSDSTQIAEVHVLSWRETYAGLIPDGMLASLSIERRADAWKKILESPASSNESKVFVAQVADDIVGFGSCGAQRTASLTAAGFDGEIGSIYVLRAHQHQGIGIALMRAMAIDLCSRGYRGAALWVLRDNARAREFYERCKGRIVAEREDVRADAVLAEVAYGWSEMSCPPCPFVSADTE